MKKKHEKETKTLNICEDRITNDEKIRQNMYK
jgi:hypothetical protein